MQEPGAGLVAQAEAHEHSGVHHSRGGKPQQHGVPMAHGTVVAVAPHAPALHHTALLSTGVQQLCARGWQPASSGAQLSQPH